MSAKTMKKWEYRRVYLRDEESGKTHDEKIEQVENEGYRLVPGGVVRETGGKYGDHTLLIFERMAIVGGVALRE